MDPQQLDLFKPAPTKEQIESMGKEKKFPWISLFPNWMPTIGEKAIIQTILGGEYGYTLYDTIRIDEIDGDIVSGVIESRQPNYWKNGFEIKCEIKYLWPCLY